MALAKDALRSQQSFATFEGEEQSLVKQGERSILLVEGTLRDLMIAEFDQRLNTMQNDITKNVITTLTNLI